MKVFDLMSESVVSVGANEPIVAAARLLKKYNIGALPVCDDNGKLKGVVTDRDIAIRCVAGNLLPNKATVSEIMTRGAVTIDENAYIGDAARIMAEAQIRRLPVCKDGALVGMLSLADLARSTDCDTEAAEALCEISKNIRHL